MANLTVSFCDTKMSDNEFEEEVADSSASKKIESKRIFINHVDTFNGKNLSRVFCLINFFSFSKI